MSSDFKFQLVWLLRLWAAVIEHSMNAGRRVRIKAAWHDAGRQGVLIAPSVRRDQWWAPLVWDDEEDPTFHKVAGLEVLS